jgi:hypothetical protein
MQSACLKGANSRGLATGQFRTHSRVIAAMAELDKRYAGNVGDVLLFKRAARWL